ncbi:hypothetical protein [Clostridium bowmanii]|uniref:hypothetical protein n=1 Tax=Clostridium bowmanii TaxID=132925 RepID=UPI001C0C0255|nr:hypothetical protein [Clostridium bowmanii]MBU3188730.1 hypothetical protein [Clostridium bowmanii]
MRLCLSHGFLFLEKQNDWHEGEKIMNLGDIIGVIEEREPSYFVQLVVFNSGITHVIL